MEEQLSLEDIYKYLESLEGWEFIIERNVIRRVISTNSKEELINKIDMLLDALKGTGEITIKGTVIEITLGEDGISKKHIFIATNINNLLHNLEEESSQHEEGHKESLKQEEIQETNTS